MKNFLKISLLTIAVLLMQGCATHQNFVNKYNAWVGQDINDLIQKIGYPDSTYTLPNKNKVYVYERSRIYSYPSTSMGYWYGPYHHGGYGMFGYGTDVVQKTCKLYLETNKKGIIIKWGSSGNACVSN
ncbi:hypothetical protein ACFLR6_02150 [Campylobacterota bacterium]